MDQAFAEVRGQSAESGSAVTLGIPPSLSAQLMPRLLHVHGTLLPGLGPFVEGFSSVLLDLLMTGRLDVAVPVSTRFATAQEHDAVVKATGDSDEILDYLKVAHAFI